MGLLLVAWALPAQAAIWGYIDAQGRAHVASERLDEHYQLFFAGRSNVDIARAASPLRDADDEAFRQSALYLRVMRSPDRARYAPLVQRSAAQFGVDPLLVQAIIAAESAFDATALSEKGAVGLMQVLPATGERYGVAGNAQRSTAARLLDPALNIRVGTQYLRELSARYPGDLDLVIAAYNAGEQAVERYGKRIPPYAETVAFVETVQRFRLAFAPPSPPPPVPARIIVPPRTVPTTEGERP